MVTSSLHVTGSDGFVRMSIWRRHEIVNGCRWQHASHDGTTTTDRADRANHHTQAEVRPISFRVRPRIHWSVREHIDQLWHRGYLASERRAMDCPTYTTFIDKTSMAAGNLGPAALEDPVQCV